MKRHKALIPLSHDHHLLLLLAQLIKKNAPDYKGLPKDLKEKLSIQLIFIIHHLNSILMMKKKYYFPQLLVKMHCWIN